jgi:hypothetical protein
MAIWYTDVANNQLQGVNFPGQPGSATLTTQPGSQNNPLQEGPPEIIATYIWTGNEAANDYIRVAIAPAGTIISPNGKVSSGVSAPATTLTFAIGDNDLADPSLLPITNPQAVQAQPAGFTAPEWVSGTSYVPGNVVTDSNSTPAKIVYTCVAATSGSTAPHSAANTVWMPNTQRYSNSINVAGAAGNVAFAGGTQLYGGPALAPVTGVANTTNPGGLTAAQALNQPYQIQGDCWIQVLLLTCNTPVANTVSVFRIPVLASN